MKTTSHLNDADEETGETPLHVAVKMGSVKTVQTLLILPRIRLDISDLAGNTVLHSAVGLCSLELIQVRSWNLSFVVKGQLEMLQSAIDRPFWWFFWLNVLKLIPCKLKLITLIVYKHKSWEIIPGNSPRNEDSSRISPGDIYTWFFTLHFLGPWGLFIIPARSIFPFTWPGEWKSILFVFSFNPRQWHKISELISCKV